ncbi:MAG: hypothetical protein J6T46_13925 [Victivallales bacterium]|nr:hypothetical protein [Victivallales bacterium]
MALSKVTGVAKAVIRGLEKRPWIPMAVYLVIFVLFVAVSWTLLANLVDSKWRLMPVLSASAKLMIGEVVHWIYRLLYVAGVVAVVVVPCVMLCSMRFKSAFYTLVMGVVGIAASATFMLLTAPIWFVLGIEELDAMQELGKDTVAEVYKDYDDAAAASKDLGKIIPPGATDITVVFRVYFQGCSNNFRCRISKEDLMNFAAKRQYAFKEYNLLDYGQGRDFSWHDKDDTLFSQFPEIEDGQVVNHHPDGYLSCVAIDGYNGGKRAEEELLYLYDVKCSILWAKRSR